MSAEQEIRELEGLVERIESYTSGGKWRKKDHAETLELIKQAKAVFSHIIDGYIDTPDRPSVQQAFTVSNLQERLHHAEHRLPLPPLPQTPRAGAGANTVTIYTNPT